MTPARASGFPIAVALGAGVLGAVQPEINTELGARLGSSLLASLVNFVAAFAAVVVALALRPGTRRHLRAIRTWPVPRWTFAAGLGGAVVVLAGVVSVATIGVAAFSIAFFSGQIASGLVVDRLGMGPGGARPVVPARAQAAALAIVAVVVSQLDRPFGKIEPLLIGFVVLAGAASAMQAACNGRIVGVLGDAAAATTVNVTVGATALAATVAIVTATGSLGPTTWPGEPWLYGGGLLGVTIVLSLAIATSAVGVLRTTIAMLAAQLTAAFVVDWVVDDVAPSAGVLAGAALVVVAVIVIGRGARA